LDQPAMDLGERLNPNRQRIGDLAHASAHLADGRVFESGSPRQLILRPADTFEVVAEPPPGAGQAERRFWFRDPIHGQSPDVPRPPYPVSGFRC
jgi:hypothetical protein